MSQPDFYFNGSKAFDENGKMIDERAQQLCEKYWTFFKEWISSCK
jgi:hypothetical protein